MKSGVPDNYLIFSPIGRIIQVKQPKTIFPYPYADNSWFYVFPCTEAKS